MDTPTSTTKTHLFSIDVLRGAAILMVLSFHMSIAAFGGDIIETGAGSGGWTALLRYLVHFGSTGVSLFFVISGYVIHRSYLRDRQFSWRGYAARRFWRIYPAYFVALVGFAGWMHLLPTSNFILHAGLVHNFSAETFFAICPSFWSLAVEVQLYLLYPLAILARRSWGASGMLRIGVIVSVLWHLFASFYTSWPNLGNQHIWTSPLGLWSTWLLGAYLAEQHSLSQRVFRRPFPWIVCGLVLLVLSEFVKPLLAIQFSIAALVAAVLMEIYLHRDVVPGKNTRLISFVGTCSYSLYLIHQPLLKSFLRILAKLGIHDPGAQFLIGLPAFALIATGIAWVMYRTVEQGGVRLGKKLFPSSKPAVPH